MTENRDGCVEEKKRSVQSTKIRVDVVKEVAQHKQIEQAIADSAEEKARLPIQGQSHSSDMEIKKTTRKRIGRKAEL